MKKLISVLLVLSIISGLFAMCGVTAFAANNILNYISYEINDGEVTITDCDESISGDVVIPDTIEGYPVITILYDAFADCDGITSVYISENIREDYEIFNFFYCGFGSNIEKYIVDEKNKNFSSDDSGVVYNKDKTVLFRYPCGSDSSEFVIPESVEKIGAGAFMDCYSLIGVTIPYGVELIEAQAFMSCTSLQYIEVPDDTILDYSVFYGCTSLEEAVIGRSEGLSDSLFYGCSNLENVKINTRVISGAAFDSCCNLKNVEFGTNVNKIESGVFNYCESLEEIYIPASVTEIEEAAFYLTKELKNIIVDENNPAYASENGMLLNKDKTKLIYVPYKNEYVHDIPESVTTVGTAAYYVFIDAEINLTNIEIIEPSAYIYCFEADEIVIPESVNHIMLYAFGSCCFAKDIYIYNPDVQIDEKSIGYCEFEVLVEKDEFIEIFKKYFFEPNEEDREIYYAEFENSISYYEDMLPIPGVTIHGYAGSTAEAYAAEHGFNFVLIDSHNYVDTVITPATYTQAGVGGMVCDHCGDVQSTYEIPMLEIEESEEKVDKDTGVSVVFPEGTFDGEAQIEVTPVEDGEAYYKLLSHKEGNYKVTMFDINVTVDGQKVQPNGTVLVQIPLPKGYNQNKCVVYYVADDGTMEELKTYHNKDGYVYFETDHFSYYAILEETTETENDSTENENDIIVYLRSLLNKYIAAFLKFIDMIKSLFGMK